LIGLILKGRKMIIKNLKIPDFEEVFGEKLTSLVKKKIDSCNLAYIEPTTKERDNLIMMVMQTLNSENVQKSGPNRAGDWVKGWAQNAKELKITKNFDALIPKYFGKLSHVRWKQQFIKPINRDFEYDMAKILQYWVFEKHLSEVDAIYEFGCGTGHNLFRAEEINKRANIYGLDWAESSQDNIKNLNQIFGKDYGSHRFDFFNVDKDYKLEKNSGIYTFAALEQVGSSHVEFINYLIEQDPAICVHIEPIGEMLNPAGDFVDYLSVAYFRKRGYLSGFTNTLTNLAAAGKIEIVQKQRSFIGSLYVDGYSIVAWRPLSA
tara:strand:- start:525 stop:1484 length:960 start_codon:yes stop_codon:yes gene_type:complete